jgi:hypothetical protein
LFCRFCPDDLPWFGGRVILEEVNALYNSLNCNGAKAYVFSPSRGEAENVLNDACHVEESFKQKNSTCYSSHLLLGIMSRALNMTLRPVPDPQTDSEPRLPSAVHLCILCNPIQFFDEIQVYNPKLQVDNYKDIKLAYCYKNPEMEDPKWTMLTKPFDLEVWICIGLSIIGFSLIYRDMQYGLDLIWFILGQVSRERSKVLSCIFVIMIVIPVGYLCKVTTDTTSPLKEPQVKQLDDILFTNKFKYVIKDDKFVDVMIHFFESLVLRYKSKVKRSQFKIVEELDRGNFSNWMDILSKNRGITIIPNPKSFQPVLLNGFTLRFGDSFCSIVKESYPVDLSWFLRMEYATRARSFLERLQIAGLGQFWEDFQLQQHFASIIIRNFRENIKHSQNPYGYPQALTTRGPLKLFFFLYVMLKSLCVIAFAYELVRHMIGKKQLLMDRRLTISFQNLILEALEEGRLIVNQLLRGENPFMGMTSVPIYLSVRLLRFRQRVNIFELGFHQ